MSEPGLQVVVRFPPGVSLDVQGPALLRFEQYLRFRTEQDIRVVKDLKGDDSKLRVMMTVKQRESL